MIFSDFTVVFYGVDMLTEATVKTWAKTRVQNLLRHKSGRYYARLFFKGKEIWKSLKTSHFSVAEARIAQEQKDHSTRKSKAVDPASAKMTFKQAATLHMRRINDDVSIKRRTRDYWQEVLGALWQSWPELAKTEIRRITEVACLEWAACYSKTAGSTRYNNTLSILKHILKVGMENGIVFSNPAAELGRKPVRAKKLELPTKEQFVA
ncbi:MAG: hypothetical protein WCD79_05235 [Chthoniobacteraceae bacterium]